MNRAVNDFDWASCADGPAMATSVPPAPVWAASGPKTIPQDLHAFVCAQSVRQAAKALDLSLPTIHGLRNGYWPNDARRILHAWAAYRGSVGRITSSWFLRRVHADGTVHHAGQRWTAMGLAQYAGELVAVARMPGGALLVQTLELPAQRMQLQVQP